jgi:hypothetical protein
VLTLWNLTLVDRACQQRDAALADLVAEALAGDANPWGEEMREKLSNTPRSID